MNVRNTFGPQKCSKCQTPTGHKSGVCRPCRRITCVKCGELFDRRNKIEKLCGDCYQHKLRKLERNENQYDLVVNDF
jgi:hypothetical protein